MFEAILFHVDLLGLKLNGLEKTKNVYHRKLRFSKCANICVPSPLALDSSHCILAEQLQFYYFCLKQVVVV